MQTETLTDKLDRYSTVAKSQTAHGKSVAELAGYAAAAGASLAMAGNADAAIIYSGIQNISVQIDPTVQATSNSSVFSNADVAVFNIGGAQFQAGVGFFGELSGSVSSATAKYIGLGLVQAQSGSITAEFLVNGASSSFPFRGAFLQASHADIGPSGNFTALGAGLFRINNAISPGPNTTVGNFPLNATGIAGFKLSNGDFGWIRLKLEDLGLNQPFSDLLGGTPLGDGLNYPDKLTVIDWAYEDSGAAIHAGDTGQTVPEPSSLALLAAGATGISAFRRRKAAKAVH